MLVVSKKPNKGAIQSESEHKKLEALQHGSQLPKTDAVQDRCKSVKKVRTDKVLEIRKQLAEGHYNVNRGLNAVFDRILEDILG